MLLNGLQLECCLCEGIPGTKLVYNSFMSRLSHRTVIPKVSMLQIESFGMRKRMPMYRFILSTPRLQYTLTPTRPPITRRTHPAFSLPYAVIYQGLRDAFRIQQTQTWAPK